MKLISSEGVRETNRMEVKMSNLLTVIETVYVTRYTQFQLKSMSNIASFIVLAASQFGAYSACPEDFQAPDY